LQAETGGVAPSRLLRANLLETGVLFQNHLDARIELRTGPFVHPFCRYGDVADDKELQVARVPRELNAQR